MREFKGCVDILLYTRTAVRDPLLFVAFILRKVDETSSVSDVQKSIKTFPFALPLSMAESCP